MEKLLNFLNTYFVPAMGKLAAQKHLRAIRDGMLSGLPLLIIGSFFLLVLAFKPMPAIWQYLEPYAGKILMPFRLTMGIYAVYVSFGIGYNLSRTYKLDTLAGGMIATTAFMLTNMPVAAWNAAGDELGNVLVMDSMSGKSMFVAIIMSVIAVEILRFCKERNLMIKMPDGVPEAVARSFAALIPMASLVIIVGFIHFIMGFDIQTFVIRIFEPLVVASDTLSGLLVSIFLVCALWFGGIHGDSVVLAVATPIMLANLNLNMLSVEAGQQATHILTHPFLSWFVWIGGSGATVGMVVMMCFSKAAYLRSLGKTALLPGICNINEPIVFGLPIMLNPLMLLPFVLGPLIIGTISYFACTLGLVTTPYIMPPWTLPGPLGAFLATGGDWRAIVLQLMNLTIVTLLYVPFFRAYEKQLLAEENAGNE